MYAQQLKSARERLFNFTGNGRYSVLKTSASSSDEATTPPLAEASKTSDVAPDAPTSAEAVAPITSSSERVIRRPNHYKDTRR